MEKRTLAFGTCRVAGPFEVLTEGGFSGIEKFPHHLHYPAQVLQVARHYDGARVINDRLLYLMSEDSIRKSATRDDYVRSHRVEVKTYKGLVKKYDKFVIELSALNEVLHRSGMFVEYFAKRDLDTYKDQLDALRSQGLIDQVKSSDISTRNVDDAYFMYMMHEISNFLGNKPILWVSHFDAEAPERVREARKRCINLVKRGAKETGGHFFDPSIVLRTLGQKKALKENGEDLSHFTDEANAVLAEVYRSWIETGRHKWIKSPLTRIGFWRNLILKASGLALIASTGYYFA